MPEWVVFSVCICVCISTCILCTRYLPQLIFSTVSVGPLEAKDEKEVEIQEFWLGLLTGERDLRYVTVTGRGSRGSAGTDPDSVTDRGRRGECGLGLKTEVYPEGSNIRRLLAHCIPYSWMVSSFKDRSLLGPPPWLPQTDEKTD